MEQSQKNPTVVLTLPLFWTPGVFANASIKGENKFRAKLIIIRGRKGQSQFWGNLAASRSVQRRIKRGAKLTARRASKGQSEFKANWPKNNLETTGSRPKASFGPISRSGRGMA
jgi:hypothetical protein